MVSLGHIIHIDVKEILTCSIRLLASRFQLQEQRIEELSVLCCEVNLTETQACAEPESLI